jgi:hypothetical protein
VVAEARDRDADRRGRIEQRCAAWPDWCEFVGNQGVSLNVDSGRLLNDY